MRRLAILRQWFSPARLPALIGATLLFISWFYLSWNATIGETVPMLRFRTN